MDSITISQAATWGIAALATGGVIVRPWGFPEAIWAVLGAAALVLLALLPWHDAAAAIGKGTDVYLFSDRYDAARGARPARGSF